MNDTWFGWRSRRRNRRRIPPQLMVVVPALVGVAVGALVEYLLDPMGGRTRRARLRDRSRAAVRRPIQRVGQTTGQKVTYLRGRATGLAHAARPSAPPADDRALVDRVRSEVLGDARYAQYTVNVDAVEGVVTLRGQLDDDDTIRDLAAAVGKVAGVQRVENLLHTPQTTAPNVQGLQQPGE